MAYKLNVGEAHAVYLTVEIEGKDIGHAGDIVQNGHDALVKRGCQNIVLCADTVDDLSRRLCIEFLLILSLFLVTVGRISLHPILPVRMERIPMKTVCNIYRCGRSK